LSTECEMQTAFTFRHDRETCLGFEGIESAIAIPANEVFQRQTDALQQQALDQHTLRILAKADAGAEGLNRRFVVTNRPGDPQRLFNFYEGRGQAENYIKELKNQFRADRLSCSRFEANAFRLVLFALAYQLVNVFRRRLSKPSCNAPRSRRYARECSRLAP
jgi:hypothetical protein